MPFYKRYQNKTSLTPLHLALLIIATAISAVAKPNLVLIVADDLGYGDVGYQGGDVPTPNIDSIAENGITFSDGYVTCPVCAPSRAGMLTGRYQQTFGFWDNIGPYRRNPWTQPGIPTYIPILSERMKALGYTTGCFGKTHDGEGEAQMAFNRWDEFYGFNNGASNYLGDMNRPHNPIFHNKKIVTRAYSTRGIDHKKVHQGGALTRDLELHLTDQIGDHAVQFIETNKNRPFLAYLPFNAIHGPFQAPKPLIDKYARVKDPKRRVVMAMLESLDQNVGKILDALKRNNLEEHTLVVFLSDNGGHEASPNTPLRGAKGTYWEGGLRVPFCMQWKNVLPAGKIFSQAVSSLDIMPTFISAAGGRINPAWNLDGVDLLPQLTGQTNASPHDTLYWVWGPRKAIREGTMKAMTQNDGKQWQLFDLAADRAEQHNLAETQADTLQRLIAKHLTWEEKLLPQLWGWKKELGHKDPRFGKPMPYHEQGYFDKEHPVHLFILSGQSNMQGLRPQESFTPLIEKTYGARKTVIVHDALGGQPIRRWYKKWTSPDGQSSKDHGDLYDRLIGKVKTAIEGKEVASVTFLWMQGERDAREKLADVYADSFNGLLEQLRDDLNIKDINYVIGRLSDFDMKNEKYPHWTRIRDILVDLAEASPRGAWVDTDDLNDGHNRRGQPIKNDLHYSDRGYRAFGHRLATEAIRLIDE